WELKGQAMRELLSKLDDPTVETYDGYRRSFGDAWYMVLPDPVHPSFMIYAEGSTGAEAERMLSAAREEIVAEMRKNV
ncbi:MAG TPA: hypothetical protein PLM83_11080, partial [Bacillota bacterium]|nr:hypothetical protein [Bacillota bacterium]